MAAGSKFCSVCGATYRGSYLVHAGTVRHRRAARGPSDSGIRRLLPKRRYRAPKEYAGEEHVSVKRHRRRPPLDGQQKRVRVVHYWRRRGSWFHARLTDAEHAAQVAYEAARRYVR